MNSAVLLGGIGKIPHENVLILDLTNGDLKKFTVQVCVGEMFIHCNAVSD